MKLGRWLGVISIVSAFTGAIEIFRFNHEIFEMCASIVASAGNSPSLVAGGGSAKLYLAFFGLVGFVLGIVTVRKQNKTLGWLGIALSIIEIVCSFIPFWMFACYSGML